MLLTTNCWRYCRFAKQICSYSSIGTDTRCCSNGAGLFKHYLYSRFSTSRGNPLNDGTVKEHNLNPFDFWKEARTCRARCAVIFFSITQHRVSSGAPKIKRNSLNDNNFSTDGYFKEIPEQRKVGLFFTLCRVLWYFLSAQKVQ